MIQLLILADDYTGALDCGAQLKAGGAEVRVLSRNAFSFDGIDANAEVIVINTETRHLKPNEAKAIVHDLSNQGVRHGVKYIYKKTDSALRGNIGAELEGVLEGTGNRHAYFVPAFPALKRITRHGIHYIDGIPLADSSFGKDPFEPATDSKVAVLLHRQTAAKVYPIPRDGEIPKTDTDKAIFLFDAETENDLSEVSDALYAIPDIRVMAGCAGFAAFLPRFLHLSGIASTPHIKNFGLLAISGTLSDASKTHLANARSAGFDIVVLSPEQKLDAFTHKEEGDALVSSILSRYEASGRLIVTVSETYVATGQTGGLTEGRQIAGNLGQLARRLYDRGFQGVLLVTGGDVLQGVLNAMDCAEVIPTYEIESGVELSQALVSSGPIWIVSKAGSMGSPEVYRHVADCLKELSGKSH